MKCTLPSDNNTGDIIIVWIIKVHTVGLLFYASSSKHDFTFDFPVL